MTVDTHDSNAPKAPRVTTRPPRKHTANLSYHTKHVAATLKLTVSKVDAGVKAAWEETGGTGKCPRWVLKRDDCSVDRYAFTLKELYADLYTRYQGVYGQDPYLSLDELAKPEQAAEVTQAADTDPLMPAPGEHTEDPEQLAEWAATEAAQAPAQEAPASEETADPVAAARAAMRAAQES